MSTWLAACQQQLHILLCVIMAAADILDAVSESTYFLDKFMEKVAATETLPEEKEQSVHSGSNYLEDNDDEMSDDEHDVIYLTAGESYSTKINANSGEIIIDCNNGGSAPASVVTDQRFTVNKTMETTDQVRVANMTASSVGHGEVTGKVQSEPVAATSTLPFL